MSQMKMLWIAIGLSLLGALLIWFGMFFAEAVMYIGLAVFAIGMLIGPLTHFASEKDEEVEEEKGGE
jgi:fatty acid desaturase